MPEMGAPLVLDQIFSILTMTLMLVYLAQELIGTIPIMLLVVVTNVLQYFTILIMRGIIVLNV